MQVVQGRGLQLGDAALVDFDAKLSDTGEVFEGAKRRKTHMDTDSADMQFLPGLDLVHPAFMCIVQYKNARATNMCGLSMMPSLDCCANWSLHAETSLQHCWHQAASMHSTADAIW